MSDLDSRIQTLEQRDVAARARLSAAELHAMLEAGGEIGPVADLTDEQLEGLVDRSPDLRALTDEQLERLVRGEDPSTVVGGTGR